MSLSGKVALVTGAAQGLGKAFSEALLKRGAKVCLADVQSPLGEATTTEFQQEYGKDRALFVKCDVSSVSELQTTFTKLLSEYGQLDIMINNAGIMDEHNPARMVDINLTGVIMGTNMAVDVMSKEKGGQGGIIINVASTAGITPRAFFTPAYTGTKFGVAGFTRSWSYNPYVKKMGLRFACLCPAFTATDILNPMGTLYPVDAEKITQMIGINEIPAVVAGFIQLVEDEQCNGAVMTITAQEGIQFYKKPLALSKM
ncbi:15-hydroxyprostaglandin dehydrogenase [NAD(+)]-like [Littorina saxatilis]|uniref:15-hydroxyprostaglandin dehydrogenase [NAD(+)] n=1 Tax=Littorina saxatilis TaxID=31220 RepID=A0AAN9GP96_9CAEN